VIVGRIFGALGTGLMLAMIVFAALIGSVLIAVVAAAGAISGLTSPRHKRPHNKERNTKNESDR